jgi:hypothetical protein
VSGRATALAAGATLLAVYVATLAPDVTFWDAGEFIAAARALGIPHPPGTPLYVIVLNAWARLWAFLPFAAATNLFSAFCTAAAAALSSLVVWRATRSAMAAFAAVITAGTMSSVWQNATETEVYAASLLLSVAAVVAGDQAGRRGEGRWGILAAYLLALSVPLHLSALVAAPAVVYLAARRPTGGIDWGTGLALTGAAVSTLAVSRTSSVLFLAGVALTAIGVSTRTRFWPIGARPGAVRDIDAGDLGGRLARVGAFVVIPMIAFSALAFLLLRARHDPAINQGNPSTLHDLAYVVARRQYDVAALWPRQAPWWIQLGNWFEYADWQVALSLAPTVIPNVWRVLVTAVFAILGIVGSVAHRRADRRSWTGALLLFACGSLGVMAYLNLKAGPSFGWGVLSDNAPHEARERDYFFVLSFWVWGLWAGQGAVAMARRVRAPASLGAAIAALPVLLNWSAVNRRAMPEASMPRRTAAALLEPLPPRAVLFVAGDNDTYPLWYAQQVRGLRPDVTIVTLPLLGAAWYDAELVRRHGLGEGSAGSTELARASAVAASARALGRPVAAALTVPWNERNQIGRTWTVIGSVALESPSPVDADTLSQMTKSVMMAVDSPRTRNAASLITKWGLDRTPRESVDPVYRYLSGVLSCPRFILDSSLVKARGVSLDSLCNFR